MDENEIRDLAASLYGAAAGILGEDAARALWASIPNKKRRGRPEGSGRDLSVALKMIDFTRENYAPVSNRQLHKAVAEFLMIKPGFENTQSVDALAKQIQRADQRRRRGNINLALARALMGRDNK